jgi:hypothetical protein
VGIPPRLSKPRIPREVIRCWRRWDLPLLLDLATVFPILVPASPVASARSSVISDILAPTASELISNASFQLRGELPARLDDPLMQSYLNVFASWKG